MHVELSRAIVIGAGNMGAGIAAHLANAGISVLLLDRPMVDARSRNELAEQAVERQLRGAGFMHPDRAQLVESGNVEDDLARVSEADWIVEAVFEDLEIKRELYAKLERLRKPGSVVSSNTSTIPLAHLTEGLGDAFARDFVVTHFFNPPRVMKLLELVGGKKTSPDVIERVASWCDRLLGKTVIHCRDTPGFIANRIGNYWMSVAALEAKSLGLTVEEADAVMGAPFGIPRTGIFGLFDYVGVNLVPLVWGSFMKSLSADDAHRQHDVTRDPFITRMLELGRTGRAVGSGFYRTTEKGGKKIREALDLSSGEYRAVRAVQLASLDAAGRDLRSLCEQPDRGGRYAWNVLSHLVSYTSEIGPEIAGDVASIDVALRLGYNWSFGPFELADRVGVAWLAERLSAESRPVPALLKKAVEQGGFYSGERWLSTTGQWMGAVAGSGALAFSAIRRLAPRVAGNDSASLWDIGEGVLALEVHTKMNACNEQVVDLIEAAPGHVSQGFRALVIANDHPRAFSVGADIGSFVTYVKGRDWAGLVRFVERGQSALRALRMAHFPVVGAPFGLALGGGCELQLCCDASVAHAELNAGLPELKVGILPGWGGCTRLLERWIERSGGDAHLAASKVLEVLIDGTPSGSALVAVDRGLLRRTDRITMNRDRLLEDARQLALELADGDYRPASVLHWSVLGADGAAELYARVDEQRTNLGFSEHDMVVVRAIAEVLSGGDVAAGTAVTDMDILALEVDRMVALAKTPKSLARMEHMLQTGKPLRN
ncbi:3-hydroxyacyl-CoA dehydrogenase/enoyl-CoA hydratase family protein [Variovorax sp. efr-133-TYG-130]|uniref:3-hydroxyacyl-CoA dehydrogenase/enoyl-CoA hydratase family protein n=1 Tax=Variovorax sp. efr-133-TYG-130 TaxID=3040327 RepID=UPI0025550E40|nr:3-hydroxyacyl-CoA dehydrogenase/enoyl-CoA hydratase family protein [Variovorax sp. efr-133-TYG-130]